MTTAKTPPMLERITSRTYYYKDGKRVEGHHEYLRGDITGLWGDVTDLRGDATDLRGNVSGLWGDLNNIPQSERPADVADYVKGRQTWKS